MTQGGIYQIRNTITGSRYVGRACSFKRREAEHKKRLRRGAHSSRYLQNAWNLYGEDAFVFEPVIVCAPEHAPDYEQRLLDSGQFQYNVSRSAWTPVKRGEKRDPAVVEKMAASKRGKPQPRDAVLRRAEKMRGNQYRSGIPHSAEVRAQMCLTRRGRKHTAETREKQRIAASRRATPEYRQMMREALLGRVITDGAREKISAALTGRKRGPMSEEHRAKISAGQKAAHAAGRGRWAN